VLFLRRARKVFGHVREEVIELWSTLHIADFHAFSEMLEASLIFEVVVRILSKLLFYDFLE
jgi:hypothetical protein